ncbi:MAG TPA: hypothetical protein VI757_08720 [Bacteroidia bacterium]|nr:hypothetical protein [Bacteroidia bacterium]
MDENTDLKNEVERLNKIISILVDRIDVLKRENIILRNVITANKLNIPASGLSNGTKDIVSTIPEKGSGTTDSRSTIPEKGSGTTDIRSTIPEKGNGTNDIGSTIPEKGNGINANLTPVALVGAHPIEINYGSVLKLSRALKKLFPVSIKHRTLRSVASQLLLLHNSGHASYSELRKISGLSVPGFAKHAPKLQRQGLIRREGYQKYALTQQSKTIISQNFPA